MLVSHGTQHVPLCVNIHNSERLREKDPTLGISLTQQTFVDCSVVSALQSKLGCNRIPAKSTEKIFRVAAPLAFQDGRRQVEKADTAVS